MSNDYKNGMYDGEELSERFKIWDSAWKDAQDGAPSALLSYYQNFIDEVALYPGRGSDSFRELLYLSTSIASETGELLEPIKKTTRGDRGAVTDGGHLIIDEADRMNMILELGDILFYVREWARFLNCSLEDVMMFNMRKLEERRVNNALGGHLDAEANRENLALGK